jgi:predicted ATP-grasp superfamily ATP-dependent carboligase
VQPFIPGRPASVAFLIGPRQTVALAPAWQHLSDDGRFHYRGGSAPMHDDALAERAVHIARRAVEAVPGLGGYVGVDLLLGDAADAVIEINPRLTTSYVGLRALAADNLMGLLLRVVRGESVAAPRWRPGGVHWMADGQVHAG